MLLIYAGVRAVSAIVEWRQWDSLRFGEYGEDSAYDVQWRAVAALAIIALQCHFLPFQCFTLFCWQLCNTKAVTSNIFVLYRYIYVKYIIMVLDNHLSPQESQCSAQRGWDSVSSTFSSWCLRKSLSCWSSSSPSGSRSVEECVFSYMIILYMWGKFTLHGSALPLTRHAALVLFSTPERFGGCCASLRVSWEV